MGLELDFSDNLVAIGGFYSERGYLNSSIKGMFYVTLDQTTNKNYSKEIVPFLISLVKLSKNSSVAPKSKSEDSAFINI